MGQRRTEKDNEQWLVYAVWWSDDKFLSTRDVTCSETMKMKEISDLERCQIERRN